MLLPSTNSRPLMAVVLMLVALCAALAIVSLIDWFANPDWGPFITAVLSSLLGVGLWKLHPLARGVVAVLLWALIIVLIGGVFNPFTAGDLMAQGRIPPGVWVLVAWITPPIAISLAVLHILGKFKGEFGRKGVISGEKSVADSGTMPDGKP